MDEDIDIDIDNIEIDEEKNNQECYRGNITISSKFLYKVEKRNTNLYQSVCEIIIKKNELLLTTTGFFCDFLLKK